VNKNRATLARNVRDLRDTLGVRSSDNLQSAEVILLVEGEDDRICLYALLSSASEKIKSALHTGFLAIDTMVGAGNLSYKLGQARDMLCDFHIWLDHDKSGTDAIAKAMAENLADSSNYHMAICAGRPESEMEDLISTSLYESMILKHHNVSLRHPKFGGAAKWSDRMRDSFRAQGKPWNQATENQVKKEVAHLVAQNPDKSLNPHLRGPFDSLVNTLEKKITSG
jgi:hypothetical protein